MATVVQTRNILQVKSLCVDYLASNGAVHAVDKVSFTLERGQILGLAGESGSGKSTLAYAITRLLRLPAQITGGQILYYPKSGAHWSQNGKSPSIVPVNGSQNDANLDALEPTGAIDVLKLTPAQLRQFRWQELSIVFQSAMNALNPVMNIESQIADVLSAHDHSMGPDARRERIKELLRLVGIAPDRMRSYPHELSGGMRQRAIIAIALALNPEIIIMDEPTTALDVVVQREILSEIVRLREKLDFSVIFITHDLSLLLELADKVAIMYAGRLVEMATQRDLYNHARHPYTNGLLNSFPTLHRPRRKMTGIPGSPPDLRNVPSGCAFNPRCTFAFSACTSRIPELLPSTPESPEQLVACHLYDPSLNPAGPPDFKGK